MSESIQYTAVGAASMINTLQGKFSYNNDTRKEALGINRLYGLKKSLEDSEKEFYNALGVSDPNNLGKALNQLVSDLNGLLNDPVVKLCTRGTGTPFIRYFRENYVATTNRLTAQDIIDIFDLDSYVQGYRDSHMEEFKRKSVEDILNMIRDGANESRVIRQAKTYKHSSNEKKEKGYSKLRGYRTSTVASIIVTEGRSGRLTIKPENVSYRTFLNFGQDLYDYFARRMEKDISEWEEIDFRAQKAVKKGGNNISNEDLRKSLVTAFREYTRGKGDARLADEIASYLMGAKIDVSNNDASIAGALGEAAAEAMMSSLANKYPRLAKVLPIGRILNQDKKQIPTDLLLELLGKEYGIQVKNYTLKGANGSFTFNKTYQSIVNMGRAMEVPFLEALVELFGMYQFNQYRPGATGFDFGGTRGKIEATVEQTKEYLYSYVDRLLGVDKTYQADIEGELGKMGLHFNTFFMISGKIIPSSVIVGAIIDTVDVKSTYHIEDMSITYGSPILNEASYPILRPIAKHYGPGGEAGNISPETAASYISGKVRFVINYGLLFQTALSRI